MSIPSSLPPRQNEFADMPELVDPDTNSAPVSGGSHGVITTVATNALSSTNNEQNLEDDLYENPSQEKTSLTFDMTALDNLSKALGEHKVLVSKKELYRINQNELLKKVRELLLTHAGDSVIKHTEFGDNPFGRVSFEKRLPDDTLRVIKNKKSAVIKYNDPNPFNTESFLVRYRHTSKYDFNYYNPEEVFHIHSLNSCEFWSIQDFAECNGCFCMCSDVSDPFDRVGYLVWLKKLLGGEECGLPYLDYEQGWVENCNISVTLWKPESESYKDMPKLED